MTENKPTAGDVAEAIKRLKIVLEYSIKDHPDVLAIYSSGGHEPIRYSVSRKDFETLITAAQEAEGLRERVLQVILTNNDLMEECTRLTAEIAAVKPKFMGLSPPPCDKCGYNGPGYYQLESHSCVGEKP